MMQERTQQDKLIEFWDYNAIFFPLMTSVCISLRLLSIFLPMECEMNAGLDVRVYKYKGVIDLLG